MVASVSPRRDELLERAYRYALEHGVADLSLRPLAAAVSSSPRVLLFLFGSKAGLVQALLARARQEELVLLDRARAAGAGPERDLIAVASEVWRWLAADEHQALLKLWVEGYARSLIEPEGLWAGFAAATVADWLEVLGDGCSTAAESTLILAILRGGLLDLLATGDRERTTAAVEQGLELLRAAR